MQLSREKALPLSLGKFRQFLGTSRVHGFLGYYPYCPQVSFLQLWSPLLSLVCLPLPFSLLSLSLFSCFSQIAISFQCKLKAHKGFFSPQRLPIWLLIYSWSFVLGSKARIPPCMSIHAAVLENPVWRWIFPKFAVGLSLVLLTLTKQPLILLISYWVSKINAKFINCPFMSRGIYPFSWIIVCLLSSIPIDFLVNSKAPFPVIASLVRPFVKWAHSPLIWIVILIEEFTDWVTILVDPSFRVYLLVDVCLYLFQDAQLEMVLCFFFSKVFVCLFSTLIDDTNYGLSLSITTVLPQASPGGVLLKELAIPPPAVLGLKLYYIYILKSSFLTNNLVGFVIGTRLCGYFLHISSNSIFSSQNQTMRSSIIFLLLSPKVDAVLSSRFDDEAPVCLNRRMYSQLWNASHGLLNINGTRLQDKHSTYYPWVLASAISMFRL